MKKRNYKNRNRISGPLSRLPDGFFQPVVESPATSALSLSPFYAALRLFQTTIGSLPLVTYKDDELGRERAKTNPAYHLLHQKPNPAMTRAEFWERCVYDLFMKGEFFIQVIWKDNGTPAMLLPVPWESVEDVELNDDWTLSYKVQTGERKEPEIVPHTDMIHVKNFPDPEMGCFRGLSLTKFANQALQLHKEVQTAGTEFFKNVARPGNYVAFNGNVNSGAADAAIEKIDAKYAGGRNRGKTFWIANATLNKLDDTTAEEAGIIEALSTSTADIARWFGVSPLTLGDLSRGTYSNLAADNTAFYQRSVRPLLDKIELAVNDCLFAMGGEVYAEFLVDAILRGDPAEQADIDTKYIQAGVYLRQEVRNWKNLPYVEGLDEPTLPLNMGGNPETTAVTEAPPGGPEDATAETQPEGTVQV